MKQLKEVCAYIRVSTGKQEELSPDSQLRLIKEYAQAHDMLLTHVYMEEHGISGKSSENRPGSPAIRMRPPITSPSSGRNVM